MNCNKKLANQHLTALIQQASKNISSAIWASKKRGFKKINHKPSILCFSNEARERGGEGREGEENHSLVVHQRTLQVTCAWCWITKFFLKQRCMTLPNDLFVFILQMSLKVLLLFTQVNRHECRHLWEQFHKTYWSTAARRRQENNEKEAQSNKRNRF